MGKVFLVFLGVGAFIALVCGISVLFTNGVIWVMWELFKVDWRGKFWVVWVALLLLNMILGGVVKSSRS